jgi:hypothetical protein
LYDGCVYDISGVDFERREIEIRNRNGNYVWLSCQKVELAACE